MWQRLYWCQLCPLQPIIKPWWKHHMTAISSAYSINKCELSLNSERQRWSIRQMQRICTLIGWRASTCERVPQCGRHTCPSWTSWAGISWETTWRWRTWAPTVWLAHPASAQGSWGWRENMLNRCLRETGEKREGRFFKVNCPKANKLPERFYKHFSASESFPSTVLQDRLESVCYHSPAGVPLSVLSVLREGAKRDLDMVSSTSL